MFVSTGAVQLPPIQQYRLPGGDTCVKGAAIAVPLDSICWHTTERSLSSWEHFCLAVQGRDYYVVKAASGFPGNTERGLPSGMPVTLVLFVEVSLTHQHSCCRVTSGSGLMLVFDAHTG